jgi:Tol biopolymer transport system component
MMVQQYVPGQLMPQIYRARPDGSERQDIAYGAWSALSPDGTTAAYITSDGPGLVLHDLATNQTRLLAGSKSDDYAPVFSPDSAWVAFFRFGDGIYIARVDGSDTHRVFATGGIASPSAWSPDGTQLYIQAMSENGVDVMRIDVNNGQTVTLFNTGASKGASGALLSPDGSRFAYSGRVFGQINPGVFVVDADGANPRPLTTLDTIPTIPGAWSPDGTWLLISVAEYDGETPVDT